MIDPISDVVLQSGISRLNQLESSNLAQANKLNRFSKTYNTVNDADKTTQSGEAQANTAPDLGDLLVTLTKNSMGYSMASRAISSQLSLYSTVIAEGKAG